MEVVPRCEFQGRHLSHPCAVGGWSGLESSWRDVEDEGLVRSFEGCEGYGSQTRDGLAGAACEGSEFLVEVVDLAAAVDEHLGGDAEEYDFVEEGISCSSKCGDVVKDGAGASRFAPCCDAVLVPTDEVDVALDLGGQSELCKT